MSYFSTDIEKLARAADMGEKGANGKECPECRVYVEELGMGGGKATCPVCSLCFKYHHPQSGHGSSDA